MVRHLNLRGQFLIYTIIFIISTFTNAFSVEVSGIQSGVWRFSDSPYIITGDIQILQGMTLTIEPGVVAKFSPNTGIRVEGTLLAKGRNGRRIVFTSVNDNEFGTTDHPSTVLPTNRDWRGIEFIASSGQSSDLEFCIIRYSEKAISSTFANPTLKQILFSDCAAQDFILKGKKMAVQNGIEMDYLLLPTEKTGIEMNTSVDSVTSMDTFSQEEIKSPQDSSEILPGDEFSFGEISVVSAAKYAQPISEAPAAISVLTGEEIRWVGYSNLQDMMRFIPGIDVSVATPGNINVNPRGYNRLYSNRTLVLVDGRTVYLDFFGVIFWPTIPVQLEEIDRMEVIRGPGGSLYGANAYSGVVNIITQKPEDINGTRIVSQTGGLLDTYRGSFVHGARKGNTSYKMSLGWRTASEYNDRSKDALKNGTGNVFIQQDFGENSSISLESGYSNGTMKQLLPWGDFAIPVNSDIRVADGKVDLKLANWKFTSYVNSIKFDALGTSNPFAVHIDNDLYNFSLENHFSLGRASNIVWGATHRIQTISGNVFRKQEEQGLSSAFGQINIRPAKSVIVTAGARADQNPAGEVDVPLKASLMLLPGSGNAIRFSYGRSYRSASLVETFVVSQFGGASVLGNKNLHSEIMDSYEFGYRANLFQGRLGFELDIFHEKLRDFIIFSQSANGFTFDNFGESKSTGGEVEMNFRLNGGVRGRAFYSYQKVEDAQKTIHFANAAPRNKYGLYLGMQRGKFIGFVGSQYIDRFSVMIAPIMQTPQLHSIDSHILVNARIGFIVNDGLEISVEGFNVINERFREYPLAEKMRNRITCTVRTFF